MAIPAKSEVLLGKNIFAADVAEKKEGLEPILEPGTKGSCDNTII